MAVTGKHWEKELVEVVDQLKTSVDALSQATATLSRLDDLKGYVDGIEAKLDSVVSGLSSVAGSVDGLEAALAAPAQDLGALITLAAVGAGTTNSADQTNVRSRGVKVVVDITVAGGAPTLTVTLQGKDQASGKYYDILTSAALAIVGTAVLTVVPGLVAVANVVGSDALPPTFRVRAVVGGVTPAITATVGVSVLP